MTNLPVLAHAPALVVRQHRELLEAFTAFEIKNRYVVQLPDGQPALYAAELGSRGWGIVVRNFLRNKRPFTIQLRDLYGNLVLQLDRPWRWFSSELYVRDGQGQPLGRIDQRFAFFASRFVVLDPAGRELAQLHGPFFRPWTFRVVQGNQQVGRITKQWGGLLRETFTDADTFGVEFGPRMDPQLRMLALAATFLIDLLYFEKTN